jgi:hypothetical protein
MRTGCSQQAIVKTFHILPYMVKQQAITSGLPYVENIIPEHCFWKYTIKLELYPFTTLLLMYKFILKEQTVKVYFV